jgi:hypothetical protein
MSTYIKWPKVIIYSELHYLLFQINKIGRIMQDVHLRIRKILLKAFLKTIRVLENLNCTL